MSTFIAPLNADEAEKVVQEKTALAKRLYQQRLFEHPFMLGLKEGSTPDYQLKAFIKNWYTFALEVNTATATVYHRHVSFFKTHRELEDMFISTIAEEFTVPGPGGHIRMMQRVGEAAGLSARELIAAPLIPEARAWVDFQVRLLTEGTLAEIASDFICEGEFGHFAGIFFEALVSKYKFSPRSSEYFSEHYESDAAGKGSGNSSHGERGQALLQALLREGLATERAGWGITYTIDITVAMFELLLDGIVRRHSSSDLNPQEVTHNEWPVIVKPEYERLDLPNRLGASAASQNR
jgi:pyrroloquinoline quinone (PQQ) biosynthesis protein C